MIPTPVPAAVISADLRYRYFLSRALAMEGRVVTFIGLNPSTADAVDDDPTIRRCINFAKQWGARELWMVNLYAYRDKSPKVLLTVVDPVGPENDHWLDAAVSQSDVVVAAWGNHATLLNRSEVIRHRHKGRLQALKVTGMGMPSHPLYLSASLSPMPYN